MVIGAVSSGCDPNGPSQAPPPEVTVVQPLVRQVTDWDEYTGRLVAPETVEARTRVSGYPQAVPFTDGAIVNKGDLLFVIDSRP